MRRRLIIRPPASDKKIHCRNEFELCYLRHQYLRKVNYNPTKKDMEPYFHIATSLGSKTFFTYKPLLLLVGLEKEDVINIANVHLVSFLGLFSLEKMPEKYNEFVGIFQKYQDRKPKKGDILHKNQANFTLFLKQRMEDLIRICRQKARNIKGLLVGGFSYYCGPKMPPRRTVELVKNYERLGFRKLDSAIYKSIKKRAGIFDDSTFLFGDTYYIAVPIEKKSLTIEDFDGADVSPRDTIHNMNPEEIYSNWEDSRVWSKRQEDFDNNPRDTKVNIIKDFIKNNKSKNDFRQEIKVARRLLKELE
jgi:hypothetical protein